MARPSNKVFRPHFEEDFVLRRCAGRELGEVEPLEVHDELPVALSTLHRDCVETLLEVDVTVEDVVNQVVAEVDSLVHS